ncbi:hypothetical protein BFP72_04465 [Reichenbachiella sp. 5M10]|uniref:glycosyl hydrolase 115 family protein n=1 Tax=Reichenbachiella sp. 5M10 TaxID=1889772 RepID=UPI000C150ACC|nr:glycosyl hydrolase 115 family protein [Reichenbachiella sp. 5M10]PIB34714.1 hypothetical protein BFP72_04465 [Reichenbachiella sp. 5M10]
MKKSTLSLLLVLCLWSGCQDQPSRSESDLHHSPVSFSPSIGDFPVFSDGQLATLVVSESEDQGIQIAVTNLQDDLLLLTGQKAPLVHRLEDIQTDKAIIIGSAQKPTIQSLGLELQFLENKWEQFVIQGLDHPTSQVSECLVIAGSDKRGTIYGVYQLSQLMGVSPWYWWADVPVVQQEHIFVRKSPYTIGEPRVKYRGIFINDEAPALTGMAFDKFGGFNAEFYSHVFELILRLKGNYLWPAMWGKSIYEDDPQSPILADQMGVVLGTSHHEPLSRAHIEWSLHGQGPWNYSKNKENLKQFWREGVQRMGTNESIVTVGMRGDGDEPMTEGTAIQLLENIVKDQRTILSEVTGKPAKETPQMWALYKEVQDYYDQGMRVDDDITLLLCDDNWGNIRKLPTYGDTTRAGGYGIYYHFDYVGGPRNYKWINTTQISRVWEQMTTAYAYGVDQIWIVNVGDLKPMEFPISFFLDLAWDPRAITADQIPAYGRQWAKQQFGTVSAEAIAYLLDQYTLFNSRRKPEMLSMDTYSLTHYREFERVVRDYNALVEQARQIKEELPPRYHDAYFQLVEYPIAASANLNEMYYEVAKNHLYAQQGRTTTSETALRARQLYEKDSLLTLQYHSLRNGKWNHMMSQTHIGYTYWQQPDHQSMPTLVEKSLPLTGAHAGIALENSELWWPNNQTLSLPKFDSQNNPHYYIELFNRGTDASSYDITSNHRAILLSKKSGNLTFTERIEVSIDWAAMDDQSMDGSLTVSVNGEAIPIHIHADKLASSTPPVLNNGALAFEASDYSRKVESEHVTWLTVPQLGRTGSSVIAQPPMAKSALTPNAPHLAYDFALLEGAQVKIKLYTAPTLNYHNDEGLSYAISVDSQDPVVVNIHQNDTFPEWEKKVANNAHYTTTTHILDSGQHTLKIWHIDSKIPMQKIDLTVGDKPYSYLGVR